MYAMIYRLAGILFMTLILSGGHQLIAQSKKKDPVFDISSRIIEKGDSVVLSWYIKKADSVKLEGMDEKLPSQGSYAVFPDTTVIFEIKFWLRNGKVISKKRKVNVVLPVIEYFRVPEIATDEEEFEIKWRVGNASFVKLINVADSLGLTGSIKLQRDTTTRFVLMAVGKHNRVLKSATTEIQLLENAWISKKVLYRGDTLRIGWKIKQSTGVFLEPGIILLPLNGTKTLKPPGDTVITLCAQRRYGKVDTIVTYHIIVKEPGINYFWGENSILRGDRSMLTWSVNGGERVSITGLGDDLPRKGALEVSPGKTTTYVLQVTDGDKLLTREWKIRVYPYRKYISSTRRIEDVLPGERLETDILSVDRSKYPDEILLRVVVVDTSGNYISGLAPESPGDTIPFRYFTGLNEIFDNKHYPVKFDFTEIQESASTPYDISVVLDYSGSMVGTIGYLEESIKQFVLRKYLNDRISITKFDDKINTIVPLLTNPEEIFNYFSFTRLAGYGGKTALYAGADKGLEVLDSSKRNKVLILFTDGNENSSFQFFGQYAITANQLATRIRESDTRLFIISYGAGTNSELLFKLASLCDGKTYFISSPEYITSVFDEMPRVLHQYYEIRYKPVQGEGNHRTVLSYDNHTSRHSSVFFDYFIGENIDLSDIEFDTTNYWYRTINGKHPVSPPQVAVNFVFNEELIRSEYLLNLEKYLKYLNAYPETEIDILAHADHVGTENQCLLVSQRRAFAVRNYFLSKGIEEDRIHTRWFGKMHPVWSGEEESWKAAENRRVELILYE